MQAFRNQKNFQTFLSVGVEQLRQPISALSASSYGKRGTAAPGFHPPSPGAAPNEEKRLASVNHLRERMMKPREVSRLSNLRDGSLMPPEPVNHSPLYAWIALLVAGMAFWTWALPKVVRAVADSIVIGANGYY